MLNMEATMQRIKKISTKRYGISLVYGLPFYDKLNKMIEIYIIALKRNYGNIFQWYTIPNLHSTILRCYSLDKPVRLPLRNMHLLEEALKRLHNFRMFSQKVQVGNDAVIRLHFDEVKELAMIDSGFIHKFALSNNLTIRIITKPWVTFGDVQNSPESIQFLSQHIRDINQDIEKLHIPIEVTVNSLKLVYYEDIRLYTYNVYWSLELIYER